MNNEELRTMRYAFRLIIHLLLKLKSGKLTDKEFKNCCNEAIELINLEFSSKPNEDDQVEEY